LHHFNFIISFRSIAQDGDLNYRYWQMRQRFVDQFVKFGGCNGCSLPFVEKLIF
jgi:hypothetical protein